MVFGKYLNDDKDKQKEAAPQRKSREKDDDNLDVEHEDGHIYYYTEVNKASILDLNRAIHASEADMLHTANILDIPAPSIKLHINSPGGSLFDGLAAVDYVRKCKVPVHSIIEGMAASAATLISVMAHKRSINKHSYMIIHQLSSGAIGKFEELMDDMENNKALMKAIKQIYLERTKIPESLLKDILKKDIYFDAKQCLKYGLVDNILE
jgi:ATP-dependent Clp endopeptidase proteolytic subunit ClpP